MLKSFINNGIKIYSLTSGNFQPSVSKIRDKKLKNGKTNKINEGGVEILNDLEFSERSDQIKISADGRYICISGLYPPQVGIYDTLQMSIKERRHFDEEVVDMEFLTTNYEKIVFLQKCRNIEFHKAGGKYHKIRLPKEGRKLTYNKETANLYICTSGKEIYNLNLQKGCYENCLSTENQSNNFFCRNPELPLYASGGSDGILEMWDMRTKGKLTFLKIGNNGSQNKTSNNYNEENDVGELTSCCFSENGLKVAIGTINGVVYVYDIRHSNPLLVKDHFNDLPINKIEFLKLNNNKYLYGDVNDSTTYNNNNNYKKKKNESNIDNNTYNHSECIASCDDSCIEIYSEKKKLLSLQLIDYEDKNNNNSRKINKLLDNDSISINSFAFYPNSGLCLIPCDNKKVFAYFIPFIGLAPKWCSFLDNLTEELEEKESNRPTVYDTYKDDLMLRDEYVFVTNEQVDQLNINHLKGTKNLISYLHGYYIPAKIYADIKSVVDKDSFAEIKKRMIQKQLEQKQKMRIPEKKTIVNAKYASELMDKISQKKRKKEKIVFEAEQLFQDDRFNKLFSDPDYAVEHIKLDN